MKTTLAFTGDIAFSKYFNDFLKRATDENAKYSKISVMLGFLSGFGVFIMVI